MALFTAAPKGPQWCLDPQPVTYAQDATVGQHDRCHRRWPPRRAGQGPRQPSLGVLHTPPGRSGPHPDVSDIMCLAPLAVPVRGGVFGHDVHGVHDQNPVFPPSLGTHCGAGQADHNGRVDPAAARGNVPQHRVQRCAVLHQRLRPGPRVRLPEQLRTLGSRVAAAQHDRHATDE